MNLLGSFTGQNRSLAWTLVLASTFVWSLEGKTEIKKGNLTEQLTILREQVAGLEQGILQDEKNRKNARLKVRRIQKLISLQKKQRVLGAKRVEELENTVRALESRQLTLREKLKIQQKKSRRFLIAIEASQRGGGSQVQSLHLPEFERTEAPRRKVLAAVVERGLKEVKILESDLVEAAQLAARIQEEKQQLAYLFLDLNEEASVLELNRQLQMDILQKKKNDRLTQLANYRKLKSAEAQVERLLVRLNAKIELENTAETEKRVSQAMQEGGFPKLKGHLPFPVAGSRVLSGFGRVFDSQSGLYVFKKGIDLRVKKKEPVRVISAGKIVYAGELPHYGQVVIVDHGGHFYSLYGHLGKVSKKTNDSVMDGNIVGLTSESDTPLYFEIRARNVAVNPLQWMVN